MAVPEPGVGEVLVSMRAAGVNPVDSKIRSGLYSDRYPVTLPSRVGREVSGVVSALGAGVTGFSVGDEVLGAVATGGAADDVVVPVASLAHKPPELDWARAGCIPLAGQTAWDALASQRIDASDTLLVSAAAGGVGGILVQLALRLGARVIGTASEGNHDYLATLGVEPVCYGPDLASRLRHAGVTLVFDLQGSETVAAGLELGVAPHRINSLSGHAARFGVRHVGRGIPDPEVLASLASLVERGELAIPIQERVALAEFRRAYEILDIGHVRGKLVLVP
ncbi:NADP-dependent oxidoreductase [Rhodoglobus aureus]|uniref:NADP-dependent oxidoreductase n=1 Tax=Rhodoglobus aureus TaxID=191497 RepID=A0ABP4GG82_9MICO